MFLANLFLAFSDINEGLRKNNGYKRETLSCVKSYYVGPLGSDDFLNRYIGKSRRRSI